MFKKDMKRLVERLGVEIRVAHDPPYCSKYNLIEHRLFPHLSQMCRAVIFESVELMEKAETSIRLRIDILDKLYQKGRKSAEAFNKASTS